MTQDLHEYINQRESSKFKLFMLICYLVIFLALSAYVAFLLIVSNQYMSKVGAMYE